MGYSPHLLDELARVFAEVALDQLLKQRAARVPRQEDAGGDSEIEVGPSKNPDLEEGDDSG